MLSACVPSSAPPLPPALVLELVHLVSILRPGDGDPPPGVSQLWHMGWQAVLAGVQVSTPGSFALLLLLDPGDDKPGLLGKVRCSDLAGQFLLLLSLCLAGSTMSRFAHFPGLW